MTPEQQRIAIAKACNLVLGSELGYSDCQANMLYKVDSSGSYHDLTNWSKTYSHVEFDPLNDLNAMHEAEEMLTWEQQVAYARQLDRFTNMTSFGLLHATASQRAEAFLRTLNIWTKIP